MRLKAPPSLGTAALMLLLSLVTLTSPAFAQQTTTAPTQQRAVLTGVVKDVATGQPIVGAQVKVTGLGNATQTGEDGRYRIANLPMGASVSIDVSRVGYGQVHLDLGKIDQATMTKDVTLNQAALSLEAVTSSATSDPTSGVKIPFAMTKIDAEQMPVPNLTNAAASIQGKVAGAVITQMSGDPGDSTAVVIRAIMSPFHSINPLYVVDGVPLNSGTAFTSGDFSGLDVESIEVIRGAAAAALYGSRAAGGVIAITTKRGKDVALGSAQMEFRQDAGYDQISEYPPRRVRHYFRVNDKLQWINSSGTVVTKGSRGNDPNLFMDNEFAKRYDAVGDAMEMNRSLTSRVGVSQNSATTNINVSYNRVRTPGTLRYADGQTQQSVRFFVSHQLRDNLQLSTQAQHTRTIGDRTVASFSQLFSWDPDVNLLAAPRNASEALIFPYTTQPDSTSNTLNPLYDQFQSDDKSRRMRTVLSADAQYRPFNWLTIRSALGYDKSDQMNDQYEAPGLPNGGTSFTVGSLRYDESSGDGLNGEVSATLLRDVGRLTPRLTLRSRFEREDNVAFRASGTSLGIGFRTLANAVNKTVTSSVQARRINAHSANLGVDYAGRYVGDFLYLYEGNSRFGPDNRYNSYFRAAGSWLISEEDWYPAFLNKLTLSKFRYSYGTAGNQPNFTDQYENITVSSTGGGFLRDELGNPELKPEMKYEHELGMDFIWNNKVSLQLTYSRQTVKDAIIGNAATDITGYNTIQDNVGTTRGESWEGTIEGEWMRTRIRNKQFRWWSNFVIDRSWAEVIDLGRPPYCNVGYHCTADGVPPTQIVGNVIMTSPEQLTQYSPGWAKYADQWEVDDRGYLVPVGKGNHYWEGVSKNLWGTKMTFTGLGAATGGQTTWIVEWGTPYPQWVDTTGNIMVRREQPEVGNSQQLFNWGYGNRFNYGNLQLYLHFRGAIGGDIWNSYRNSLMLSRDDPQLDMSAVPDSIKKPVTYFTSDCCYAGIVVNAAGGWAMSPFIYKDQNWAKFGEMSVSYAMNAREYKWINKFGAERVNLNLSGRNLYTFKFGYNGLDPERFVNVGSTTGAYIRRDTFTYPPTRNWAGSLTVIF